MLASEGHCKKSRQGSLVRPASERKSANPMMSVSAGKSGCTGLIVENGKWGCL